MFFLVIQLCVLFAFAHASQDSPACEDKQDLAFLVDTTTTITEQGVVMAQSLAISILKSFTIQEDYTRAAYVSFGYQSMIRFSFNTFFKQEEIDLMISLDDSLNGTASLNETMSVLTLLFDQDDFGSRRNVSRVLVFISNGKFTDELENFKVREFLKKENIKLLVAGVGRQIDVASLEKLVDDTVNDIFTAEERNARYMTRRIRELTKEFCDMQNRPVNGTSSSIS